MAAFAADFAAHVVVQKVYPQATWLSRNSQMQWDSTPYNIWTVSITCGGISPLILPIQTESQACRGLANEPIVIGMTAANGMRIGQESIKGETRWLSPKETFSSSFVYESKLGLY